MTWYSQLCRKCQKCAFEHRSLTGELFPGKQGKLGMGESVCLRGIGKYSNYVIRITFWPYIPQQFQVSSFDLWYKAKTYSQVMLKGSCSVTTEISCLPILGLASRCQLLINWSTAGILHGKPNQNISPIRANRVIITQIKWAGHNPNTQINETCYLQ